MKHKALVHSTQQVHYNSGVASPTKALQLQPPAASRCSTASQHLRWPHRMINRLLTKSASCLKIRQVWQRQQHLNVFVLQAAAIIQCFSIPR